MFLLACFFKILVNSCAFSELPRTRLSITGSKKADFSANVVASRGHERPFFRFNPSRNSLKRGRSVSFKKSANSFGSILASDRDEL